MTEALISEGSLFEVALSLVPAGMLIGGEWKSSAQSFSVIDPSTGESLKEVAQSTPDDALDALSQAADAQSSFGRSSPRSRADLLNAAYARVLSLETELATLITLEMGKPLDESRAEVRYAAEYLRWFAEEAPRVGGVNRILPEAMSRMITIPRPVGVCVLVTPWNFPLAMITRKIAPAIAAGCVSVVKPAEDTPLTTLAFARILEEVGAPQGVINVLPTSSPRDLVETLLRDGRARKLSFTGSTPVGRELLATAAGQMMRCSMELGGNAPFIVFDDADLDAAVAGAMQAKFRNGGQACTAANRFLIQESIADDFTSALAERMSELRLGRGIDSGVTLGPIIHQGAVERATALVDDAIAKGAEVVVGAHAVDGPGSFFAPTLLTDVPDDAAMTSAEIFAPVVAIKTFTDEGDALLRANATEFGLVSYLYTNESERQFRMASRLEFGMVAVNRGLVSNAAAPFGGIKQSGLGREGSTEGIDEYLDYVYMALNN